MLGIILQLLLSWLIIWLYEKGNLSFLGFYPTLQRTRDFFLFLFLTACCCSTGFLLRMYFGKELWLINHSLTPSLVVNALWWNIKSVLFEELIFRGVLFYMLIQKFGNLKALLISSIAFGIYHWFSQEVFGNPIQMILIFFLTGIMGMVYGYGYIKTRTLYVPSAIHLGWNITQGFVFSQGSIGKGVFILAKDQPTVNVSYFIYFIILLTPLLSTWLLNFLILKNRKTEVLINHQYQDNNSGT